MTEPTKKKQVRIYLDSDAESVLSRLTEGTPLSEAQILTVIASAGLQACKSNGYKLTLPLRFSAGESANDEEAISPKLKAA